MRAETDAIDDPAERARFARSAARGALLRGWGVPLGLALLSGALVAAVTVAASRAMLEEGRPGVLGVTSVVPAGVLLLASLVGGRRGRSRRSGLLAGGLSALAATVGLVAALTVEGTVWMERHGVFVLDADPPKQGPVDTSVIALDVFTTGMWVGHVVLWVPAVVLGASIGTWVARRGSSVPAAT